MCVSGGGTGRITALVGEHNAVTVVIALPQGELQHAGRGMDVGFSCKSIWTVIEIQSASQAASVHTRLGTRGAGPHARSHTQAHSTHAHTAAPSRRSAHPPLLLPVAHPLLGVCQPVLPGQVCHPAGSSEGGSRSAHSECRSVDGALLAELAETGPAARQAAAAACTGALPWHAHAAWTHGQQGSGQEGQMHHHAEPAHRCASGRTCATNASYCHFFMGQPSACHQKNISGAVASAP